MQQGNDLVVLHSLATDVLANLVRADAPLARQLPLLLGDVFIQQIHPGTRSRVSSPAWKSDPSAASRSASAIASSSIAPRQSTIIDSQLRPLATWSSTSATKMRVPRKVGCP